MNPKPEKNELIAWFIMHNMETTFKEVDMASLINERDKIIFQNQFKTKDFTDPAIHFTPAQNSILRAGMLKLAWHMPTFLFNNGITDKLIPASSVHCILRDKLLGVDIDGIGTFILDIEYGTFHATIWKKGYNTPAVNEGKPIALEEFNITANTHKRNLRVERDYSASINRDLDYLSDQLKDKLRENNIPASIQDLLPTLRVNWIKNRGLVRALSGFHEVYKGLGNTPVDKELYSDSPLKAIYDIGTAQAGKGNLPGLNGITGGEYLVNTLGNDVFEQQELDLINDVQSLSPEKGGGYEVLVNQMERYNYRWDKPFVGYYLNEEQLAFFEKLGGIPADIGFTKNFSKRPVNHADNKPYRYFIYVRSEKLQYSWLSINDIGVIYINPGKD
ncbi:hypothetical protein CLV51_103616 [Chitinophaga niastensis]|uniref:Uncharacterized protein n=1 Tax=Chitinophaga niastensis TaxID=536980 RepID=A0A2P8HK89_CHINA|nr:hypothetical protein [Chitinophaga niastensis]PSL46635.1 hypothetical protein CLV51_103616 [Chitinophaga niastensis]